MSWADTVEAFKKKKVPMWQVKGWMIYIEFIVQDMNLLGGCFKNRKDADDEEEDEDIRSCISMYRYWRARDR